MDLKTKNDYERRANNINKLAESHAPKLLCEIQDFLWERLMDYREKIEGATNSKDETLLLTGFVQAIVMNLCANLDLCSKSEIGSYFNKFFKDVDGVEHNKKTSDIRR